jgi:anti-anti-sigma factor
MKQAAGRGLQPSDAEIPRRRRTTISASVSGEIARIAISGSLVHGVGAAAAMQRAVYRCAASPFTLLVINLRNVEQIDAAGISALVVAYEAAQSVGARFRLAEVPPRVGQLLAIATLDTAILTGEPNSRK